jgi:hypothetical protein
MSSDIEAELRDALENASESIMPRGDLADRVRHASRRRRHVMTAALAVGLAAVLAVSLMAVYGAGQSRRSPPSIQHGLHHEGMHIVAGYYSPDDMAVHGRWIYVAAGGGYPGEILRAYDRTTGRLVRSIDIPALPSTLEVGPGGLVWLAFYPDSNGGGTGVWLLSPNLKLRSGINLGTRRYGGTAPHDLLPTGADTAVLATDTGLATLRLPPPGHSGSAALHWLPQVPGSRRIHGLPVEVAAFAGRVAVTLQNDAGPDLISLAGSPSGEFIPGPADSVGPLSGSADGLWTTLFGDNGQTSLGLIRLDRRLRLSTPSSIRDNPVFKRAQEVVTLGSAVWVILAGPQSLACFTDRHGRIGPVTRLHLRPEPARNVGVGSIASAGNTLYVLGTLGVASYPIPSGCR